MTFSVIFERNGGLSRAYLYKSCCF